MWPRPHALLFKVDPTPKFQKQSGSSKLFATRFGGNLSKSNLSRLIGAIYGGREGEILYMSIPLICPT